MFGNRRFARHAVAQLAARSLRPAIVHANDHPEALLGLEVARLTGARTALFLRSPGMIRSDYVKYRCADYEMIAAVGGEFQRRVQAWEPRKNIKLIHDGIEASEFSGPKPNASQFPQKILVLGSPLAWRRWPDLTESARLLEEEYGTLTLQFDFTGAKPDLSLNDLKCKN